MVMVDIGILAHMCHMTIFELMVQMVAAFFFTIMLTIKVDSGQHKPKSGYLAKNRLKKLLKN